MTTPQREKETAFIILRDYLLLSIGITVQWKDFASFYNTFSSLLDNIIETGQKQEAFKLKTAKEKKAKKNALVAKMIRVGQKCNTYATVHDKYDFQDIIRKLKKSLRYWSDIKLTNLCKNFIAAINANSAELEDYKITKEVIAELTKLYNDYLPICYKPKKGKQSTGIYTEVLAGLYKEIDGVLKTMTAIVEGGEEEEPEFCVTYMLKKKPVKSVHHKLALIVQVEDEDGNRLPKALATITPKDATGTPAFTLKTGKKGRTNKKYMNPAEYVGTIKYVGMNDALIPIAINESTTSKIKVVMKKKTGEGS